MNWPDAIREKLAILPDRPGVYLMKDAAGKVIYVGKAKVLKNRVRSYFQRPDEKDPKTRLLVRHIADIDFLVVRTEKEALITENNLIKRHKPRYNVKLRDDKNFLCVRLSTADDFPRIYLVRKIAKDGSRYFGPYSSAVTIRETTALLNRYFPLRKCTDRQFESRTRPCLMYQIGRCTGPCVGLIEKDAYAEIVREVILFLEGRSNELSAILEEKMTRAAADLAFEEAARVRDQIAAVAKTLERQTTVDADLADRDVLGLYREGARVELAILFIRNGKVVGSRAFALSGMELEDAEIVSSFVGQFYGGDVYLPAEVLVPVDFEDREDAESVLRELRGRAVRVRVPVRGDKRRLVAMAGRNAEAQFRARKDRQADASEALEAIRSAFHLPEIPETIDCFDISNIGGRLTVGSKVRFSDGGPDKSGYRRFRVRTADPGDDYGAMFEVIGRWIDQARKEETFPNLVLVDGGKGQLAMAARIFAEKEYIQSPLASIAKPKEGEATDKFYLPGRKNPIVFKPNSSALYLLQRVRDEAHRFAIEYNRKLRKQTGLRSALDAIPGVGAKRRKALLSAFGSLKKLKEATREEIEAVDGIPPRVAADVHAFLNPQPENDED